MTLPRQRGVTEQAADAAIDSACRLLRLPSIRNEFSDIADRAMKDQMTYRGFLGELLMAECDDRARRRSERRIKAANYGRVDLLCIDELGYIELDRHGAELLFRVVTEREEKNSVAIASNESFGIAHMFRRTRARCCRNFTGSMVSRGLPSRLDVRATRS
ncbi:ATP-binding protein [Streptomyces sp. NPDC059851]|uniref:ATP-binding protein n=1 Tax=Streptomyces sp. NPDC059851 TaxID=3346971 RepID=UPI00364CA6F1